MDNDTLRRTLRKQRKALSAKERSQRAFLTSLHLPKLLPLLPKCAKIGLYLDDFGELPTLPILSFCQRYGYAPYLPITKKGQALQFAPCFYNLGKTPLKRHALGMYEPIAKGLISADKLDAIICPLVAVDRQGNRLGMGGGYYDRTFAKAPKVLKVGWCYDFQIVEHLAVNAWDKGVDMVLTDGGLWRM